MDRIREDVYNFLFRGQFRPIQLIGESLFLDALSLVFDRYTFNWICMKDPSKNVPLFLACPHARACQVGIVIFDCPCWVDRYIFPAGGNLFRASLTLGKAVDVPLDFPYPRDGHKTRPLADGLVCTKVDNRFYMPDYLSLHYNKTYSKSFSIPYVINGFQEIPFALTLGISNSKVNPGCVDTGLCLFLDFSGGDEFLVPQMRSIWYSTTDKMSILSLSYFDYERRYAYMALALPSFVARQMRKMVRRKAKPREILTALDLGHLCGRFKDCEWSYVLLEGVSHVRYNNAWDSTDKTTNLSVPGYYNAQFWILESLFPCMGWDNIVDSFECLSASVFSTLFSLMMKSAKNSSRHIRSDVRLASFYQTRSDSESAILAYVINRYMGLSNGWNDDDLVTVKEKKSNRVISVFRHLKYIEEDDDGLDLP